LDIQKAISFVEENGTELERYRLSYLLGEKGDDGVPLGFLMGLQNDDGGFPYKGEKGKLSSVNHTISNLSVMIELGLTGSEVCRNAVDYLVGIQGEDGGWDENHAVSRYDPPFWDLPGDLKTKMWLTASVLSHLILLGYRESEAVRRGKEFLLRNRDEEGKFFGFLHSTWISVGVFGQLEGAGSEIVKNALEVIERNLDRLEDGAGDFIWCLECFYVAGVSKGNTVVRRCVDRVIGLQRQDGAWTSGDGEEYSVSTTIGALRILRMYKVW
jgi:hypothetical protein